MALDPRMILQGAQQAVAANQPLQNLLAGSQIGQALAGERQRQNLLAQQAQRAEALAPLQEQLLQQQVQAGQLDIDLAQAQQRAQEQAQSIQALKSGVDILKPFVERGDLVGAAGQLESLRKFGFDDVDIAKFDQMLATGNLDQINQQFATIETLGKAALGEGEIIKGSQRIVNIDGKQFSEVDVAQTDGALKTIRTPVGGAIVRKGTGETIEEQRLAEIEKKRLEEEAKLKVKGRLAPKVEADIIAAKEEAKSKGEKLSALNQAKAALPGLQDVVSSLRSLAPIATSTFTGKAFDIVAKEAGFGATEGATARARFISIIDNEMLPLLKQTFGAAFTVEEGKALKATLGDPDAAPEAKMAQLDSFIESKLRQIETQEREVGGDQQVTPAPQGAELQEGVIIRNPQTGERLQLVQGQWVGVQ